LIFLSTISAIFGLYKVVTIYILLLIILLDLFNIIYKKIKTLDTIKVTQKQDIIAGIIIVVLVLGNIVFHHITLWGGHDHGVYVFSAIKLSESGSLLWDDYILRQFDGFIPTRDGLYTTHFLPAYVSYLAIFYSIGGIILLFAANSLLFFLTLSTLYLIGKKIFYSSKVGLITIMFFGISYVTVWFSRRTLSENLAMFLLWFGIFLFIYYTQRRKFAWVFLSIIPVSILPLTRPEGLAFLIVFLIGIISVLSLQLLNKHIKLPEVLDHKSIVSIFFLIISIFSYTYYISSINIIPVYYCKDALSEITQIFIINEQNLTRLQHPTYRDFVHRYIFDVFLAYNLVPLVVIGVVGFLKVINNKKLKIPILLLVFLMSPSFIFLYDPNINWVHPWFMRRYYPYLIPFIFMFGTIGFLELFKYNRKIIFILNILLFSIILQSSPILTLSNDYGTLNQLNEIHELIGDDSLVIFEWENMGNRLGPPFYFLFKVPTIASNWPDINITLASNILKKYNYSKIYVISSRKDISSYEYDIMPNFKIFKDDQLILVSKSTVKTSLLSYERKAAEYALPGLHRIKPLKEGYTPIAESIKFLPPSKIITFNRTFYIYAVKNAENLETKIGLSQPKSNINFN